LRVGTTLKNQLSSIVNVLSLQKKSVNPAPISLLHFFAQCICRIGIPLVGRSAAPMKECGYSPLALRVYCDSEIDTGSKQLRKMLGATLSGIVLCVMNCTEKAFVVL
jgi:hypothetical protein